MSVPKEDCCETMLILAKFLNLSHSLLLLFTDINSDLPHCQSLCTSVSAIGQSLTLAVLQTAANTIIPHHEFHMLPLVLFWFAKSKSMAFGRSFQWVLSARPPFPQLSSPQLIPFFSNEWMPVSSHTDVVIFCSISCSFSCFFSSYSFPSFLQLVQSWYETNSWLIY